MSAVRYEAFAAADIPTDIFVEPSDEAKALLRLLPNFVAQAPEGPASVARVVRDGLVAPFTQLTFVSFDLQVFLFGVLHTTWVAKAGHAVGMAGVNLFLMAQFSQWTAGFSSFDGGAVYAGALLCWYAAVSRDARLTFWWFACVPVIAALLWGSQAYLEATAGLGFPWSAPWVGVIVSAMVTSGSHLREANLPPRVVSPTHWVPLDAYLWGLPGERHPVRVVARRLAWIAVVYVMGVVDELWASPRLLPYNVLAMLFQLGYAPKVRAELEGRVERAVASGNPALDYVGIGGGATLVPAP